MDNINFMPKLKVGQRLEKTCGGGLPSALYNLLCCVYFDGVNCVNLFGYTPQVQYLSKMKKGLLRGSADSWLSMTPLLASSLILDWLGCLPVALLSPNAKLYEEWMAINLLGETDDIVSEIRRIYDQLSPCTSLVFHPLLTVIDKICKNFKQTQVNPIMMGYFIGPYLIWNITEDFSPVIDHHDALYLAKLFRFIIIHSSNIFGNYQSLVTFDASHWQRQCRQRNSVGLFDPTGSQSVFTEDSAEQDSIGTDELCEIDLRSINYSPNAQREISNTFINGHQNWLKKYENSELVKRNDQYMSCVDGCFQLQITFLDETLPGWALNFYSQDTNGLTERQQETMKLSVISRLFYPLIKAGLYEGDYKQALHPLSHMYPRKNEKSRKTKMVNVFRHEEPVSTGDILDFMPRDVAGLRFRFPPKYYWETRP